MKKCLPCRTLELCHDHGSYRLVTRDKLEPSMWINQYVMRHYRPTNMTNKMCAKSVFHWTNETINIWSHLLGFIYFTYCQYEMNAYRIPLMGGHFQDHLVISLSIFGAQVCMLFSAAYHTFCCANEKKRQKFLKLDIFGISAGLLGMYLSGIYTAFFCFQDHLETYVYMLLSIFLITAYVPTREDFFDRKIVGSRIGYLHIIYTSIIIFGFCPTTHWVYLHGGLANGHVAERKTGLHNGAKPKFQPPRPCLPLFTTGLETNIFSGWLSNTYYVHLLFNARDCIGRLAIKYSIATAFKAPAKNSSTIPIVKFNYLLIERVEL
ncbi:hypothetical protein TELCIR_17167, partial [Teladorsagia circumcincta]